MVPHADLWLPRMAGGADCRRSFLFGPDSGGRARGALLAAAGLAVRHHSALQLYRPCDRHDFGAYGGDGHVSTPGPGILFVAVLVYRIRVVDGRVAEDGNVQPSFVILIRMTKLGRSPRVSLLSSLSSLAESLSVIVDVAITNRMQDFDEDEEIPVI